MAKKPVPEDHIREAAYLLWKKEGEPAGMDQEHWLKAEAELAKPKRRAPAKKAAGTAKKPAAKAAAKPAAKKPAAKKATPKA